MSALVPQINDRKQYQALFAVDSHWRAAVDYLISKHQLTGPVQRSPFGSHIVYRVGNTWLKLMAPIFAKDMAFELSGLRAVHGRLSVETPRIIASGFLEGWAYVILTHIEGNPVRTLWEKLNQDQQMELAGDMARTTVEITQCSADTTIVNRFSWNKWIEQQYSQCEERQQQTRGLPGSWMAEVKPFLGTFDISEFKTTDPVFLHADLIGDHFLVTGESAPQISGVIDFADCQVGHRDYELVAPAAFIFKGNQQALARFLIECGIAKTNLNERFSEKLLAWSLLHRFFNMATYFHNELRDCAPGDFKSLARKVFPLDR